MTSYLIKFILCTALLILVYVLMLEKEKMHKFNRFYLLTSLVFSLIVPLITFEQSFQPDPISENAFQDILFDSELEKVIPIVNVNETLNPFYLLYGLVVFLLLVRFSINIILILRRVFQNPYETYNNCRLVLVEENIAPHSFWNYIFLNSDDYNNGRIDREVLLHELAHVRQRHTLDILFVEIVQVTCWFNPVIILYRRAILLNHEFLADEAVIREFNDIKHYQMLLLKKAQNLQTSFIVSDFNYSFTKKRLIMMAKSKSFKSVIFKQIAIVLVLGISVFIFSYKIKAQNPVKKVAPTVQSTQNGISNEQLQEYQSIVAKGKTEIEKKTRFYFSDSDKKRLQDLFVLMSKEQQSKQVIGFMPKPPPVPKSTPKVDQFESFKDTKVYGVWVDEKRISNEELNNYVNTDFDQVFISRLLGGAKKGRTYSFQVDLMTKQHYANYFNEAIENKGKLNMTIRYKTK